MEQRGGTSAPGVTSAALGSHMGSVLGLSASSSPAVRSAAQRAPVPPHVAAATPVSISERF